MTDFPLFEQSTLRGIADALYDETGRMLVLRLGSPPPLATTGSRSPASSTPASSTR